jgi:hypothetical protein
VLVSFNANLAPASRNALIGCFCEAKWTTRSKLE